MRKILKNSHKTAVKVKHQNFSFITAVSIAKAMNVFTETKQNSIYRITTNVYGQLSK